MTVPMNRMKRVVLAAIVSAAMAVVFSCKEEAPSAPPAQVVNKKIAIQKPKPAEAPPTVPTKSEAPVPQPEKSTAPAGPKQAAPNGAVSGGDQPVSDLVKETRSIAEGYNPTGRIDPFEPLFRDESTADVASLPRGKHKKRTPQTPLEKVAISQLKLSAVMRTAKGNRALVEDASGKGYVIKKGTYIGLNSGQVVKIDKDRVTIEEEIENVMGEFVIQNTELKLQKPAGEL